MIVSSTMTHKITFIINKGDYTSVDVKVSDRVIPLQWTLEEYAGIFHEDVWELCDSIPDDLHMRRPVNMACCIKSPIREKTIVGELQLYSTYVLKSQTSTPVYLFRPLDYHYPSFYIHSNLKKKYSANVLISIQVNDWKDGSKFPDGTTKECFGLITQYSAMEMALFHHFQLSRKSFKLPTSTTSFPPFMRTKITADITSIDPDGCTDIDDAFTYEDGTLLIHISDVFHNCKWFPESMEELISQLPRTTSVYMKETLLPMLVAEWSSNKASLLQGTTKHMLTLEIKEVNGEFVYRLFPTIGKIRRNATYDNYIMSNELCDYVSRVYGDMTRRYTTNRNNSIRKFEIVDTHTLVEAMMIIYNDYFGNTVANCIVRTQEKSVPVVPDNIDNTVRQFVIFTQMNKANYSWKTDTTGEHSTLGLANYTHVTSPIRRMTDLLNQYIYYNHSALPVESVCAIMNKYEKQLRIYYRKRNIIYLGEQLYRNKTTASTTVYITAANAFKNRMTLYFPDESLSIRVPIVPNKLLDIREIQTGPREIIIRDLQNATSTTLPLFQKLSVTLVGKPNIFAIDDSLKIKWHDIEEK